MNTQEQEAFDTAVKTIVAQRAKSVQPNNRMRCAYRGANDCKCFVGALIPDDALARSFDANGFSLTQVKADTPELRRTKYEFLLAGQKLHDRCDAYEGGEFVVEFLERAIEFAKSWNLDPKVAVDLLALEKTKPY